MRMLWATITIAILSYAPGSAADRPAVVLTTDCGCEVDDQWALAHLALATEWELKGIVTTHAPNLSPPASESSARVAREVLSKLDLPRPPVVIAGASEPLVDPEHPRRNRGVEFLLEQARGRASNQRLQVLVIGAATDVASALLIDPTWADRVEIIAMAFASWPQGGDPWNVKNDVPAWRVLLESRAPIVVADVSVTKRHLLMAPGDARRRFAGKHKAGDFLARTLEQWLATHAAMARSVSGRDDRWPIWDEAVTAHLLGLTRCEVRPRPRLRDDMSFDHSKPAGRVIQWITAIDEDRLWAHFASALSRGERD